MARPPFLVTAVTLIAGWARDVDAVRDASRYKVALPVTVGTYTLEFTRHGVTARYYVAITASAIEIATQEAHFTRPIVESFPRGG